MDLKHAVVRHVAAAMLTGQETDALQDIHLHAINVIHQCGSTDTESAAAEAVLEVLPTDLLSRVDAMVEDAAPSESPDWTPLFGGRATSL